MPFFSADTDCHALYPLISEQKWNTPILEFYKNEQDYKDRISKQLNELLPSKRVEFLFSKLNIINSSIADLTKPQLVSYEKDPDNYILEQHMEDDFNLRKLIVHDFSNGKNPSIKVYSKLIKLPFSYFIYYLNEFLDESRVSEIVNSKLPLPEAANLLLDLFLEEVTITTIGLYFQKEILEENLLLVEAIPNKKQITKIKWNGTPGEFGAIMGELISKGYISKIKDLKATAEFLNLHFDIKNEKGGTVNHMYLYKCFSEKKRTFYPTEFKLPNSDNYE